MESVDKKMRLPTSKTRGNFTVLLSTLFLLEIFIDEQCRAVCQGTGSFPHPIRRRRKGLISAVQTCTYLSTCSQWEGTDDSFKVT